MSRTRHRRKPPGWDYWGKREGLGYGAWGHPSRKRKDKQEGKQRERTIAKRRLKKELDEEED